MRAVHGVAQLQGGHFLPAAFVHLGAQLGGGHVHTGELLRIFALRKHFDGAGQVEFLLGQHHFHAGVVAGGHFPKLFGVRAGAFEHQLAFPLFVGLGHLVDFLDLHGGHNLALADQGHFLTGFQALGISGGDVQGHRNGPEGAVGKRHFFANALPVGLVHEAFEGRKAANAHHDQVALGAEKKFRSASSQRLFSFRLPGPCLPEGHRPGPCRHEELPVWTSRNPPCFGYGRLPLGLACRRAKREDCFQKHLVNNLTKSQPSPQKNLGSAPQKEDRGRCCPVYG